MSTNRFDMNVEQRTPGKHYSRSARIQRKVPAVIYGGGVKNMNVLIDERDIMKYKARQFENALFNLKGDVAGLNNVVALMKKVQVNPLSRRPEHVDFLALDLTKTVRVFIEVKTEGKAIGLTEGGLLSMINRQIEVECLPTEIPGALSVDVSHLGVGQSVHVSELQLPAGVKLLSSPDLTIATVTVAEDESVTAAPAAAAATEGAAPAAGAAAPAAGAAAPAAAAGKDAKAAAPAKDAKK